jgi:hypothetical protein
MTGAGFPHSDIHGSKLGMAAPRGLSQPPTSFFGFRRQGIHRWLFVAWKIQMLVLAMEFSRSDAQTAVAPWQRNRNSPSGRACNAPRSARSRSSERHGQHHWPGDE